MRIRITTLLALIIYCGVSFMTEAQRIQQTLGRGVTVVAYGSTVAVTWRKFAQEPEDILYNIYVRNVSGTDYTLLN